MTINQYIGFSADTMIFDHSEGQNRVPASKGTDSFYGILDSVSKLAKSQADQIKAKTGDKPKCHKDEDENYWQLREKRFHKLMEVNEKIKSQEDAGLSPSIAELLMSSLSDGDEGNSLTNAIDLYEESHKATAQELKESDDWREMSDEAWDKLLAGIDNEIDAFKEDLKEMEKRQSEAAQKAAASAPSDMKTIAAARATLSVATNGFISTVVSDKAVFSVNAESDNEFDNEVNWTRMLKTDDQVLLHQAEEAQNMERDALYSANKISTAKMDPLYSYEIPNPDDQKKHS